VSGDQASANFVAANPQVREALENALPRLREALGDVGIQLGQANVGANTPQFASQQGETSHNPASGRLRNDADSALAHDAGLAVSAPTARWQQQGTSLVDAFA
jgi:flagellar hook-length control protein FliK